MTARTDPGASSDELDRCSTMARVNARERLASLGSSPETQLETGPLGCELAAGHDDSHIAMVATVHGGDQWWWLRWDGQPADTVEVVQIDPCDAELTHGRYADDCLLPRGHPGPHSFHLPALPSDAR